MELRELMKKDIEFKQVIKEAKAAREKNKSQILIEMKTKDLETFEDTGYIAEINKYNRTTIDKEKVEAFCEETGQELSYFQKITPVEQLKVSEVKE